MSSKLSILTLGLCLFGAAPVHAQVLQGVMKITQPD